MWGYLPARALLELGIGWRGSLVPKNRKRTVLYERTTPCQDLSGSRVVGSYAAGPTLICLPEAPTAPAWWESGAAFVRGRSALWLRDCLGLFPDCFETRGLPIARPRP